MQNSISIYGTGSYFGGDNEGGLEDPIIIGLGTPTMSGIALISTTSQIVSRIVSNTQSNGVWTSGTTDCANSQIQTSINGGANDTLNLTSGGVWLICLDVQLTCTNNSGQNTAPTYSVQLYDFTNSVVIAEFDLPLYITNLGVDEFDYFLSVKIPYTIASAVQINAYASGNAGYTSSCHVVATNGNFYVIQLGD